MRTLFVVAMIILALALAIVGIILTLSHSNHLPTMIVFTNFFEFMFPVLAVAALINYLWKSCTCCCKNHHE